MRLARAATQTQLEQALTRLLAGQPTTSDGTLTISSLCREATIRIYANQIQGLTLRNTELEDQLHQRAGHDVSVIRVGPAHAVTLP